MTSPAAHRIHHSIEQPHRDRNFAALFPVWDVLFGTYVRPRLRMAAHRRGRRRGKPHSECDARPVCRVVRQAVVGGRFRPIDLPAAAEAAALAEFSGSGLVLLIIHERRRNLSSQKNTPE
ncbi:MAG: hypothetical protein IPM02_26780 [Betaproteobacteria bacterium]|nr:hypothetical protein [Betaproteobacteria bacterium]